MAPFKLTQKKGPSRGAIVGRGTIAIDPRKCACEHFGPQRLMHGTGVDQVGCDLGRRSRAPVPTHPLPFGSVGNLDDPSRHSLLPVPIGPRGGEVELPDSRNPLARQHRQREVFSPMCGEATCPKSTRTTLEIARPAQKRKSPAVRRRSSPSRERTGPAVVISPLRPSASAVSGISRRRSPRKYL